MTPEELEKYIQKLKEEKLERKRSQKRKSYHAHKAAHREYQRNYRVDKNDERKAYERAYRLANADRIKEYGRIYRLTHADKKSEYRRNFKLAHPNSKAEEYQRNKLSYKNYELGRKFGITKQDYDAMLAAQDGRCAVSTCRTDKPGGRGNFNVDHDPATGAIRGLLCFRCNIVLHHDRGTKEFLLGLIEYLEKAR